MKARSQSLPSTSSFLTAHHGKMVKMEKQKLHVAASVCSKVQLTHERQCDTNCQETDADFYNRAMIQNMSQNPHETTSRNACCHI